MTAAGKVVITLMGRTGDGKSTVGNEILKRLGNSSSPFSEGKTAASHTHDPQSVEVAAPGGAKLIIVDNPGLMDTSGDSEDARNITNIVITAKKLGHFNMLLLVVNAAATRFDAGMQSALKLIVDSFGPQSMTRLFLIFTNRFGRKNEELKQRVDEILPLINKRCHTNLPRLAHFMVENRPESYLPDITGETIQRLHKESYQELDGLINAARCQTPFSTQYAEIATYDHVKQIREIELQAAKKIDEMTAKTQEHIKQRDAALARAKELENLIKAEEERIRQERARGGQFNVNEVVGVKPGARNGGLASNRGVAMDGWICNQRHRIIATEVHYGVQEALLEGINSWIAFDSLIH